jgi:hypothetical protein
MKICRLGFSHFNQNLWIFTNSKNRFQKQNKKIDFSIVTGCYYRKVNFLLLTALREKLFNDVDFRFVTKVSREE